MGIGPGAWVGLMLGNVPDFVILTLAVSKVEAVVVPLDPTTGNRELEMILEAAPAARAGHAPARRRGRAGGGRPALLRGAARARAPPRRAAVEVRARRSAGACRGRCCRAACTSARRSRTSSTRGATRRRSCSSPRRWAAIPRAWSRPPPTSGAAAQAIGKTLGVTHEDRVLCTMPLHTSYGFDFGLLVALANGTTLFLEDEVSPKRIAKLLREQSIDFFAGNPALYGSLVRVPTDQAAQDQRRALPELGLGAAREHRRELPRALRHPPAVLLPRHAGRAAGDRPRGQGSRDRRQARSRASSCASPAAKGERLAAGEIGPIWARSKTLSMLVGAEDPPAQARRRRPDRRRRRGRLVPHRRSRPARQERPPRPSPAARTTW